MKLFSAFNPSLREQWAALLQRPGSSLGFSALLKDTLAWSQSEMGIEPPILGSLDDCSTN